MERGASNGCNAACPSALTPRTCNKALTVQLGYLKDAQAQKQWIAYRDPAYTFEDSLAFGGMSIGSNYSSCLCALSYERINDFECIEIIGAP